MKGGKELHNLKFNTKKDLLNFVNERNDVTVVSILHIKDSRIYDHNHWELFYTVG